MSTVQTPERRPFRAVGGLRWLIGYAAFGIGVSTLYATTGFGFPCPFRELTGWECPFCGGTRLGSALLHGDVAAAFAYNPLVFVSLVARRPGRRAVDGRGAGRPGGAPAGAGGEVAGSAGCAVPDLLAGVARPGGRALVGAYVACCRNLLLSGRRPRSAAVRSAAASCRSGERAAECTDETLSDPLRILGEQTYGTYI